MRIQHNITAMNSYRNFAANNSGLSKNLEKLSSGYKINRAGDDAAGLAISEKMRAQITGIEGATKNSKDGISLIQTAEGALTEVHSMLNRMTTLAEQSANGTYDNEVDRNQLQKEVESLKSEIDRIADSTNYNGIKLLDGSLSGTKPASESSVSGNIDGFSLDATKAKNEIALNASGRTKASGTAAKTEIAKWDGATISMNIGVNDGTSRTITLNMVKNADGDIELQDNDGKALGKLTSAMLAGSAAADKAKITNEVTEAFRKAIKADDTLSSDFTASLATTADATTGVKALNLEAKTAGADGKQVTSVELSVDKGTSQKTDADLGTIFGATYKGATANTNPVSAKVTAGTDAMTAFKAGDITLYNDNYVDEKDGHKGNADKAVFEVNGHKFAIGLANQKTDNLGDDVTFISVKAATTAGATAGSRGVTLKEYNGKGTQSDSATATADKANVYLNADAMKHIASEIAKQTGVTVEYDNTLKGDKTLVDDGEKLDSSNTNEVPIFKIGKQAGTEGKSLTLQIGDTADDFNKLSVEVADMHTNALGIDKIDISTQDGAAEAMKKIKDAINSVSDTRGGLGALQNRLDHTINNLGVMRENIQNAESLIRDTDVAEEMMTYTKNSILNQSAQAMLAQANQLPQGVLQLLG